MMNADGNALPGCVIERHIRSTCSSFAAVRAHARSADRVDCIDVLSQCRPPTRGSHRRVSAEVSHQRASAIKTGS
jgi:hypothetical protein